MRHTLDAARASSPREGCHEWWRVLRGSHGGGASLRSCAHRAPRSAMSMRDELKRSAIGARSKTQGAACEDMLEQECALLWAARRAKLRRQPTPLQIVRALRPGRFECVLSAQASLDFEGTLAGGRAVFLDVKSTRNDKRFSLGMISEDQWAHAREHAQMGGLSLIVVLRLSEVGRVIARYLLEIDAQGRIAGIAHKHCIRQPEAAAAPMRAQSSLAWDCEPMTARQARPSELWLDTVERLALTNLRDAK